MKRSLKGSFPGSWKGSPAGSLKFRAFRASALGYLFGDLAWDEAPGWWRSKAKTQVCRILRIGQVGARNTSKHLGNRGSRVASGCNVSPLWGFRFSG